MSTFWFVPGIKLDYVWEGQQVIEDRDQIV